MIELESTGFGLTTIFPDLTEDIWHDGEECWYLWHDFGGIHGRMVLWFQSRAKHCNRGRFLLRLEGMSVKPSVAQSFPRYYFSAAGLMGEMQAFTDFWDEYYKKN